jgi:hypothetical protein
MLFMVKGIGHLKKKEIMIQINVPTTTKGGLIVPAGIVLDCTPSFITTRVVDEVSGEVSIRYDLAYTADVYTDLASYENNDKPLVKSPMREYNIKFVKEDYNIQLLTSPTALLQVFEEAIKNGSAGFAGVGNNTEIVYPFQ